MQYDQKQEAYRVEALITGLLRKCFNDCVNVHALSEKELTGDEARCIDMCSWKYMHSHKAMDNALARGTITPAGDAEPKHIKR
jgi:import inner membrane translocase subunit TIM10